ncbi:hypothetical protein TIFTF001_040381 [Ficus carica]|uniref:Uncharacterized protein n=1 Tax=Ficus carica TaxID=3494 RepID=A0AA88CN26_FICCA|nr:hypothetical protein TIFTF001_040381 [Ficus carica]
MLSSGMRFKPSANEEGYWIRTMDEFGSLTLMRHFQVCRSSNRSDSIKIWCKADEMVKADQSSDYINHRRRATKIGVDQIPLAFTISLFLVATKASNLPGYYWLRVRLLYAKMQLVTLVDNRQQSRQIGCQCL